MVEEGADDKKSRLYGVETVYAAVAGSFDVAHVGLVTCGSVLFLVETRCSAGSQTACGLAGARLRARQLRAEQIGGTRSFGSTICVVV